MFDFFGVLSSPVFAKVIQDSFADHEWNNLYRLLDDLDLGNLTEAGLVKMLSERSGRSMEELWIEVRKAPIINVELLEFINENLNEFKVGLLTNAPRSLVERVIPEQIHKFNIVMISSDLGLVKPDKKYLN